jgi:hypothetical protein
MPFDRAGVGHGLQRAILVGKSGGEALGNLPNAQKAVAQRVGVERILRR